MTIKHKINTVIDDLCEVCAQEWQGECRAYQQAQSDEELEQRLGDPQGLCQIEVLRSSYHPARAHLLKPKPEDWSK